VIGRYLTALCLLGVTAMASADGDHAKWSAAALESLPKYNEDLSAPDHRGRRC
jgi:hypothetical protein